MGDRSTRVQMNFYLYPGYRWVSAVGIFVLLLNVQALSTYALLRIPRIDRHAVFWVMTIAGILVSILCFTFYGAALFIDATCF